jgi:energy-coupling factor transport system ATP-binding protein
VTIDSRPASLEARDLWVTPPGGDEPVVRGVSLRVEPGEWLALSGPNGGGKTSLILALAGLWPAARGCVRIGGDPPRPSGRDPRVGIVLQDPSSQLFARTVADELAFTARNLGLADDVIERAAREWGERFGLEREWDQDPRTLSAGRQQLVLLGAALVARPRLLIADEPAAHLDPETRAAVLEQITERMRRGLAVVWATQDDSELRAASRTQSIGGTRLARPGGPPAPARAAAGETRVRCLISADVPADGPRVQVEAPTEIAIPGAGIVALVGPNGAGKSVVLAAIAGIDACPQLKVEWSRVPEPPAIVALQYPELQIFEEVVADELLFASRSRGMAREPALAAVREALTSLGWDAERMLARRTWSLSTGEKRLIEVIGALVAPSSLVLLDEPTAGLDAARRSALAEMVRRTAEGVPVVVASQDREWLSDLGARIVSLGAGHAKSQAKKRLTEPCQGP